MGIEKRAESGNGRFASDMFTIVMRTVFVGCPPLQMTGILTRLGRVGFGSYAVDSLKEGLNLVESGGFELVVSLERLEDGNGYDLAAPVMKGGGSLFIGVEIAGGGCLWLPVVDHGERVLGDSAMDYGLLELELADVLTHRSERAKVSSRWVPPAPPKVLELKPALPTISQVVAREERRQQTIPEIPVPKMVVRNLRAAATEASAGPIKIEDDKVISTPK
jgi:hypothetical protein